VSTYDVVLLVVTVIGTLGCLSFFARYGWHLARLDGGGDALDREVRVFLLLFMGNLGGLFLLVAINRLAGTDWPGREILTVGLFISLVVLTWWPNRLLSQARRRNGH
jgi:hypothetical protein